MVRRTGTERREMRAEFRSTAGVGRGPEGRTAPINGYYRWTAETLGEDLRGLNRGREHG